VRHTIRDALASGFEVHLLRDATRAIDVNPGDGERALTELRAEGVGIVEASPWIDDENVTLFTDLYELTMAQSYFDQGIRETAVFELYFRQLPRNRNYLLACGLDDALRYLERLSFSPEALAYLDSLGSFSRPFLESLREFRFTGDVYAVLEGTPVFPREPLLQVEAPLPEAQLAESFLMNQIHFQTLAASKAARVVTAAAGRKVADYGLRRMHGTDAGVKGARAFYIAGIDSTSNVLAGRLYHIPNSGTMAHSYIQAVGDELGAFRGFVQSWPNCTLLVDTYDTLEGVRNVLRLAHELGPAFRVRAIRLDSGDLGRLAREARSLLDQAGLSSVEIVASGNLDEDSIAALVDEAAPINAFGVGSRMGVSQDAPYLDMAYKLSAYAGEGRIKLSPEKSTLPSRKELYRQAREGCAEGDVLALTGEAVGGRALLVQVMRQGVRTPAGRSTLREARERRRSLLLELPERVRRLPPAEPPYPVELSPGLAALTERLKQGLARSRSRGAGLGTAA
jgi:nicotinate phosphoribosyltransferase